MVALAKGGFGANGWARPAAHLRTSACAAALLILAALTGCAVGPDYIPEPAPVPQTFKELKGWKVATPSDALDRGEWWAVYRDPKLAFLLKQVEISNQNVAAQAASYEQARAIIREAQAALFPTISATYNATRAYNGPGSGAAGAIASSAGRVRLVHDDLRSRVSAGPGISTFGARCGDRLKAMRRPRRRTPPISTMPSSPRKAQLATAYFNMLAADSLHDLLVRYMVEYKKTLEIVRNQFKAGYSVTEGDVATAEAQVFTTEAQAINALVQRAQFEHAIAMLIGRPPAELSIGPHLLGCSIPRIPVTIPSALLERRPDIAAAERTMQEQNALIGVAVAGYFPDISLSAVLQWTGGQPAPFNVANIVWSLGAAGTQVLFEGGLLGAQVDSARAVYWQSVANYRQTVLTAFQQVEDQLVAVRHARTADGRARKSGKGPAQGGRCFYQSVPGRHGGVHYRRSRREILLLTDEENLIDKPPKPIPCERFLDSGTRRRLGRQSPAHEEGTGEGHLLVPAASAERRRRSTGSVWLSANPLKSFVFYPSASHAARAVLALSLANFH